MKIKEARTMFAAGVITSFDAVKPPMAKPEDDDGWLLMISLNQGSKKSQWTLETALGEPKLFSKLDTLVSEVKNITGKVSSLKVVV